MKYNEVYATESKYLQSSEIKGKEYTLTISRWDTDEFTETDGSKRRKIIIYFEGGEKGLALNKTNADCIADAYGDDTEYWVGKKVILYVARVSFGEKMVDGLRVRIPAESVTGFPGQSAPPQNGGNTFPGDIPPAQGPEDYRA